MNEIIKFYLRENENFIELYKLLKASNLTYSGAEAKQMISEGLVKVDGIIEKRKRKKVLNAQIVEFEKNQIQVFQNPNI